MKIRLAHLREQGIDFVVFFADSPSHVDSERRKLLQELTVAASRAGLKVDKAALAYIQGGRQVYFGTPDLVRFLSNCPGLPVTHEIDV